MVLCADYIRARGDKCADDCELVRSCSLFVLHPHQVCSFLSLVDLGCSGCLQRILTDHCGSYEVAKTASAIMDNCWRIDHTVAGTAYLAQGGVAIHLQRSQMIQGPVPFNASNECYLKHASLFW